MRLTLTKDDGTVVCQWRIEDDFGDVVGRTIPRHMMAAEICTAIQQDRFRELVGERRQDSDL